MGCGNVAYGDLVKVDYGCCGKLVFGAVARRPSETWESWGMGSVVMRIMGTWAM